MTGNYFAESFFFKGLTVNMSHKVQQTYEGAGLLEDRDLSFFFESTVILFVFL